MVTNGVSISKIEQDSTSNSAKDIFASSTRGILFYDESNIQENASRDERFASIETIRTSNNLLDRQHSFFEQNTIEQLARINNLERKEMVNSAIEKISNCITGGRFLCKIW